ncbi:hypothetical protein FOZ61_000539 [Perkinsus olseni]|uniref:Uncharacterized protein n=1 Tax=Perkinsus olseni TaxID=32597 RepID=A0A7J6MFI2_PEROL|nr:hypothetical protein FOZ61_000539 [Perkinsus olseni]KAF4675841.1 hypothetical protein FOL46_009632 [Perkinsus olseni]
MPAAEATPVERVATDAKSTGGETAKAARMVCYLCRRRFADLEHLRRHEEVSDLHRANLEKLDQETLSRRLELRQTIIGTRAALENFPTSLNHGDAATEETTEGSSLAARRQKLEWTLQQAEAALGSLQEKFEERLRSSTTTHVDHAGSVHAHAEQLKALSETGVSDGAPKLIRLGDPGMKIWLGAETWKGNKRANEDRFVLDLSLVTPGTDPPVHGVAVFDGHSGPACADYLVAHIGENISHCLAAKDTATPFEQRLQDSVHQAFVLTDDDFLAIASAEGVPDGSTALVVIMWTDSAERLKMLVAHAGDSRAVLVKGDGTKCVRLTEDHKPNREDERRWVQSKGGIVIEINGTWRVFTPETVVVGDKVLQWGLAVSRSLGDLPLKAPRTVINNHPEVKVYDLDPAVDRSVVLASDGVFDVQSDNLVASLLAPPSPLTLIRPDACALRVVRRAYELLSDDNLTAVVIHIVPQEMDTEEVNTRKRPPTDRESIASKAKRSRRTL